MSQMGQSRHTRSGPRAVCVGCTPPEADITLRAHARLSQHHETTRPRGWVTCVGNRHTIVRVIGVRWCRGHVVKWLARSRGAGFLIRVLDDDRGVIK